MAEYLIQGETLTAIADAIRTKTGGTEELSPDQMVTEIEEIPDSLDTSDATATADQMASGATAYVNGEKITGTATEVKSGYALGWATLGANYLKETDGNIGFRFKVDQSSKGATGILWQNNSSIYVQTPAANFGDATVEDVAAGKTFTSAAGLKVTGTGTIEEPTLQSKTVTPSTSEQTVTPDEGYDGLSDVTVNAMPTATQATPSISVSSAGLITASSTQSAGYVTAGTKSATKQLTTQAAQTITPGTANKTIASGRYLIGTQTIKGDTNLVAGNIKSGVSIFGVSGTLTEGEDVTAETDAYTDLLTDLETAIDALPDAGSVGSGGGSVKTCTVEVHVTRGGTANALLYGYSYTSFVDGAYSPKYAQINGYIGGGYPSSSAVSDVIFYNVVCGSLITLSITNTLTFWDISIDNANLLQCGSVGNSVYPQILIQAPSEPDSVGVINLDYTD